MRYRINDEKIFADISDGIAILINAKTGIYYGLNFFTTSVFENIINGADTEEVLAELKNIKGYDETLEERYRSFLEELVTGSFIVEDASQNAGVSLAVDEWVNDELDLVISEYREAAELLLADPIHQVKQETGWGPNREVLK